MLLIKETFLFLNKKINHFLFGIKIVNSLIYQRLISVFCLVNLLLVYQDFINLFAGGLINGKINNYFYDAYVPTFFFFEELTSKYHIGFENIASLIIIVYFLSYIFIIMNCYSLLFSVIAWFIHSLLINSSYMFSYGADYFVSFALFVNILFCLSNNVTNANLKSQSISFLIRFVQIHLCIVYFFSGFGKLLGIDWLNGDAIYKIIYNYDSVFKNVINLKIEYLLISWLVLFLEVFYPVLIFYKKSKKITFYLIVGLHIGIGFIMDLYSFAFIMITLNIIAHNNDVSFVNDIRNNFSRVKLLIKPKIT